MKNLYRIRACLS